MDEEHSGPSRFGSPLRPLLSYGCPYVGAGVWALTKFPEQLRWTSEIFARVFGLAAPFYEDLTHVEGYGEALDAGIQALEREPIRVLDLCCGTGFAARQIQHAFPDAEVVGIDLSPEMVLMARREADEEGLDIEFEVDDGRALELEDESFDLVVSHNAPPFPEETMRVLGPSGVALTVWSFGGPWVGLAWPALAKQLRKADALHADGFRAGPGFYGIAEKSGIRRRRRVQANGSAAPGRTAAQRTGRGRVAVSSRGEPVVPPPPPAPPPAGGRGPGQGRVGPARAARGQTAGPEPEGPAKRITPRPRPSSRASGSAPREATERGGARASATPDGATGPGGARASRSTSTTAGKAAGKAPAARKAPAAGKAPAAKRPAARRTAQRPSTGPPVTPPPESTDR